MTRAPEINVELVRTSKDVAEFITWLQTTITKGTTLAIDTECTGLDWWEPDFVRLVQFGTPDEGYALPVRWWGKVIHHAMALITNASYDVVFHNAIFDMHALKSEGYPTPHWSNVHDTALLLRLHRSDLSAALKSKHTAELLGSWIWKGQGALKKRAKELGFKIEGGAYWRHMPVDVPAYWAYGVMDTCITARLFDALRGTATEFAEQYDRKRHVQSVIFRAEERGILVDENYTRALYDKFTKTMEQELHFCQANGLANPNSNTQVLALLETDFGFIPWEWTETGNPSVNKHVLAELAKSGGLQEDVILSLIQYKRARKWRKTYCETFLEKADHNGIIHPSVNVFGAKTGRWTVGRPAAQTLPGRDPLIRSCLKPPKGTAWWAADYSNQEPRALAHYGGSPALIQYFTEGDGTGSIHDFVASNLFGSTYDYDQRHIAKTFGLSRSYGAGADTMAKASGMPKATVEALLPAYDTLVGLEDLNTMISEVARERQPNPYIVSVGGRRVYAAQGEEFKLVNYLMQSSGADMMDDAVVRIDQAGLADTIILSVHDELDFALPKGEEGYAQEIVSLMADDRFDVPMPVDLTGPGSSWGGLYI